MRISKVAGLAAMAALASFAFLQVDLKAGWGAPFACGAGPNTGKIEWDPSVSTPTPASRAVATGESAPAETANAEDDFSVDLKALAKQKPLLVYYYVDPIADPMDDNYKFSRKFELGVLQDSVIEVMNKHFVATKVVLPAEADMKKVENQARIEIWSATNEMIGRITTDNDSILNKSPFISFLKVRVAKSDSLVKKEIARVEKVRKDRLEKEKKETAKAE